MVGGSSKRVYVGFVVECVGYVFGDEFFVLVGVGCVVCKWVEIKNCDVFDWELEG